MSALAASNAISASVAAAIILSAFVHVTWNVAAKKVSGHFGVMWLGQAISAVALLPFAVYFAAVTPAPTLRGYLSIIFCGLSQAYYFTILSKAYALGEISVVYPIARGTGVALTAIGAYVILGESISVRGALGIAAIGAGGLLVGLKPGVLAQGHRQAMKLSLLIALTLAAGALNDKVGVALVHPITYMFAMFAIAALSTLPAVRRQHRAALADAWARRRRTSAVVGLGSLVGYLIILFLYRLGPVSYIVAFRELSVVLGAIAGVVLFKEPLGLRKALGVLVIALGLILVKLA